MDKPAEIVARHDVANKRLQDFDRRTRELQSELEHGQVGVTAHSINARARERAALQNALDHAAAELNALKP
jgi:F0F1-type ATP synthase membrane subunit b/b'